MHLTHFVFFIFIQSAMSRTNIPVSPWLYQNNQVKCTAYSTFSGQFETASCQVVLNLPRSDTVKVVERHGASGNMYHGGHNYFSGFSLADPGGRHRRVPPPTPHPLTESNSFVFTYVFTEKCLRRKLAPQRLGAPPNGKSWIRHCFLITTNS